MNPFHGTKSLLVVAAHPDDEILGCGGTVARFVAEGGEAKALILSGVTTSRAGQSRPTVEVEQESARAAETIGYTSIERIGLADNRFETLFFTELVHPIERMAHEVLPDVVLTHDPSDVNTDHALVHRAVMIAFRPMPDSGPLRLMTFETLSSTEWQDPALMRFQPNCFVDISGFLDKKIAAMSCYRSELRDYPHPRSLEGIEYLARKRGIEISREFAEAFRIVRDIA